MTIYLPKPPLDSVIKRSENGYDDDDYLVSTKNNVGQTTTYSASDVEETENDAIDIDEHTPEQGTEDYLLEHSYDDKSETSDNHTDSTLISKSSDRITSSNSYEHTMNSTSKYSEGTFNTDEYQSEHYSEDNSPDKLYDAESGISNSFTISSLVTEILNLSKGKKGLNSSSTDNSSKDFEDTFDTNEQKYIKQRAKELSKFYEEKKKADEKIDCSDGQDDCKRCAEISPNCHYDRRKGVCFYSEYAHQNVVYECSNRWFPMEQFHSFYVAIFFVLLFSFGFGLYFGCLYYMDVFVVEAVPRADVNRLRHQVHMVRERRRK